ncbi:tubulin glycylase 3A-like isoform X2 [Cylas formicarius]|uniref:tubulin glycylase 3A-like isoform X2 n=1 Tax=Cylas formicarius TaxID=197179 RepID=UPI0029585C87|nr:tubulin glycylase 3A-like isoform X2 [Cylas formicarius]
MTSVGVTRRTMEKEVSTNCGKISGLVSSAPATPKQTEPTPDVPQDRCARRSKTCLESKYRCAITSERLVQLRKTVESAAKDHKVFSIRGGWPIIRKELLKRNWIEKIEHGNKQKILSVDDVTSNLPTKQEWESPTSYVDKCERTVMSRMLSSYDVDFYWSMRKDASDLLHRSNAYKLINRFSRSLFASKEGLALLLQQAYWYAEEGVAQVNFPRCYVLGFPDHYNLFVDDFRTTSCIGLLKWFVDRYETGGQIQGADGTVAHAALNFALQRCREYVASQNHADIDEEFSRVWDHEWEQFLTQFYRVVHQNEILMEFKDSLANKYAQVKMTLNELGKHWPQFDIDGMKNIWIVKPGNKCRGRGIQLIKSVAEVDKLMGLKMKYVVQKYIERPFTIHNTKFDIRQWFMVTNVQPLTIWMYRDSYLRFSGQLFDLDNFHESLHLTNYAIQCKYSNGDRRDRALPDDNMWDCHSFRAYLKQIGSMEKWHEVIYPGMRESIVCTMLSSQDTMDRRPNTFEIYGADFMVSEDFRPWLLEINCSPDLSYSTSVTSRLCAQCMEDIVKVVVDRRRDPNADTGSFELVYKQNYPRTPPYLGMNLSVRGRRLFRCRTRSVKEHQEREKSENAPRLRKTAARQPKTLPDIPAAEVAYKGPIIKDLIEELHETGDFAT